MLKSVRTAVFGKGKAWPHPFPNFPASLEVEFNQRYNEISAPLASSGILIGIFILMAFYFWDVVIDRDRSTQTLLVRLAVGAWMVTLICLPIRVRAKYCQPLFASTIALVGIGVALIIALVDNGLIVGLSGIMIVLMFNFGFLRLLFIPSLISGLIICLSYNVAAIVGGLPPLFLIANNFFLISAVIAGASVTYLLERLFRDQFLAERELEREREALSRQNQSNARYLAWLRQLAQFLRHEVRHPVAQINSSIEIAQLACRNDDRIAPYLASAALSNQQVWNLIERASQATDAEAFVRRFQPRWTNLHMLLNEQVDAFRNSNSGVQFRLAGDGLARLYVDPTQIKEALGNLLSNAASFADEGSTVEAGLALGGAHAVISVTNRGPLLQGDIEALFGPFVSGRSDRSDEHQGLGLYLVRLIAEQHGGTATIANLDDGSGVVASIALPLAGVTERPSDSRARAPT